MPSFFQPGRLMVMSLVALTLTLASANALARPILHGAVGGMRSFAGQIRPAPGQQLPGPRRNQEHLAQWMDRHSNLPLAEQQRALASEPGFHDLPPQTQQRMLDRLTQLNGMPPEQRRRIIERTEAMERLNPQQRQQVRGAMQQLGSLPEDRRRLVARAFRDLREMPPPQRQAILSSDRFRGQFSPEEKTTLSNLLAVEPFLPVRHPADGPAYGK